VTSPETDAPTTIDPARAALLLMDFQPGILGAIPDAQDLVARAFAARAAARKAGTRIVHVRVAFTDQDYAAIPPHNKGFAGVVASRYLTDGAPATGIHPGLQPEAGDIVVTKTRFGAFSTANLARFLNPHRIDTLLLAGVSTSGVVLSTLRDAADRDYRLFVLADCCADPHPDVHRVLLEHVFPRQADVIDSTTLPSILA
jgi:nicotinamidase-related amidase